MDRPNREALDHAIAAATQADLTDTPLRGVELIALLNNLWPVTSRLNHLAISVLNHHPSTALPFFLALKERKKDPDEIWPTFTAWLIENTPGKPQISYEPGEACRTYLQARIIQLATDPERHNERGLENYTTVTRELAEKLVEITRGL